MRVVVIEIYTPGNEDIVPEFDPRPADDLAVADIDPVTDDHPAFAGFEKDLAIEHIVLPGLDIDPGFGVVDIDREIRLENGISCLEVAAPWRPGCSVPGCGVPGNDIMRQDIPKQFLKGHVITS